MANEEPPVPSATDINQQLDRMLISRRFRTAENQAAFLELVVRRTLQGKKATEDQIGRKLFGAKFRKDESTDVRVTASNLRKTLAKYYAAEGSDDLVIVSMPAPPPDKSIKLPPGEAYKPSFVYNPRHEIARKYTVAQHYRHSKSPYDLAEACREFDEIIAIRPDHVAAYIGLAESFCLMSFLGWESWRQIHWACACGRKAVSLDPGNWHAHAALGAALFLHCQLTPAREAFARALALDRRQTSQYGWYHLFLLAFMVNVPEAVELAKFRAEAAVDDVCAWTLYGAYLYLTREFEQARAVIKTALALDDSYWFAYLILGLIQYSGQDASEAFVQLRAMHHSLRLTDSRYFFPGLTAVFSAAANNRYQPNAVEMAKQMLLKDPNPSRFQCALEFMSLGDIDHTLNFLWSSWASFEPPVLLAHLLPLFDGLREQDSFKDLLTSRFSVRPKWAFLKGTKSFVDSGPPADATTEFTPEYTE